LGVFVKNWSDIKKYEVILKGPGGTIIEEFDGSTVAPKMSFSVIPGTWNVMVKGLGPVPATSGSPLVYYTRLIALGMNWVEVVSGKKTSVNIMMKSAVPVGGYSDLTNYATSFNYDPGNLSYNSGYGGDGEYYILITGDIVMSLTITIDGPYSFPRQIILVAEKDVTITRGSGFTASFFSFGSTPGSQLTLGMKGMTGSLTFDGGGISGVSSVIDISGTSSTVIMNDGVTIKNNIYSTGMGTGGAVLVSLGCEFIMNGGTITGNSASYGGGGVFMQNSTAFTMNGGTITGNTAGSGGGGGVYVNGGSTFSINSPATTGSIYNNTTSGTGNNVFNGGTVTINGVTYSGTGW